jgi:pimeloyl-ACP methyl ester carboxylesterase
VPSIVPVPNNAAFAGSTDGTLNLKDVNGDPYTDIGLPQGAMNALDGFSTVAPMSTGFAEALDAASVAAGVHVYDGSTGAELAFKQDYVAFPNPNDATTLVIKPIKALKGATNYLVVVTNDLQSATGKPAAASKVFTLMKSPVPLVDAAGVSQIPGVPDASAVALEGLRQTVKPALDVALAHGITKDKVAVAWSFKTQTIGKVLKAIQAASATDPYASSPTNLDAATATAIPAATFAATAGLPIAAYSNLGSVVTGTIQLPYYLDEYSAANPNPLAPLSSVFQMDAATGLPVVKSVQNVKYLLTIPKTAGPWKVVIFQHGFTVDKNAVFGIANTLASQNYATIAIDAVLHGDRTFGLDLVNNTTGAPGPDGIVDASGTHYLNLASLLTSRDNIRQSVADLIHLENIVKVSTLDVVNNANGTPGADAKDLDTTVPLVFVGHSNGGILGTVLAGVMPVTDIDKYVLANPGGDYATILQNSGAFSPVVNAGLAAKGVNVGTPEYAAFFFAAQTVVDDGDPLNYAALAASKGIFLLKTTPDGVVPNAQTDALSLNLGLQQVSGNAATVNAGAWPLGVVLSPKAGNGFINYTVGSHSSFLSPDAATTAMQTDTVSFLVGGAVSTSNTAVTE